MNLIAKAEACWAAWPGGPPNLNALQLAMAQALFETNLGEAWPLCCNWGATTLRAVNAAEQSSIAAGVLQDGDWLLPDGTFSRMHSAGAVAQLHSDSRPTATGTVRYHTWFEASPNDTIGAGKFLRGFIIPFASAVLQDPACSVETYVIAVYARGYFTGIHPGARPIGKRVPPLNAGEQANVNDYVKAVSRGLPSIQIALTGWTPPGAEVAPENVTPNAGDSTAPAAVDES